MSRHLARPAVPAHPPTPASGRVSQAPRSLDRGQASAVVPRLLLALVALTLCGLPAIGHARETTLRGADGARFTVQVEGRGERGFLLIPGASEASSAYRPLTEALHKAGHTVVVVDLRTHGTPPASDDDPAWAALAGDARAALRYLLAQPGVERAVVVGSGLGGILALAAGAEVPAVHAGVVLSPLLSAKGHRLAPTLEPWGARPLMMMAGPDDTAGRRTASAVGASLQGPHTFEAIPRAGRGASLLTSQAQPAHQILGWLRSLDDRRDAPKQTDAAIPDTVETKGHRFGDPPD